MSRVLALALLAGVPTIALVGCSTAPKTSEEKYDLKSEAQAALMRAESKDSTLKPTLDDSAGYAVFPNAGKGGLIVGGGYGQGVVYENGMPVGYCDLTQASVGAEIGGQTFTEIIVFKTPFALQNFKNGNTTFGTQATAVAVKEGAAAQSAFTDDIAVFTFAEQGLQAQASLASQTFRYTPIESAEMNVQPAGAKMAPETPSDTDIQDQGSGFRVTTPAEQ